MSDIVNSIFHGISSLFGGGGGGGSSGSGGGGSFTVPQHVSIPAFTDTGGITPEQQSLADFTYGQNLLGQANLFGTEGLGQSTMATQGAQGAATGKAQQEGQMSDTNTLAEYGVYQNDITNFENILSNQQSLAHLAQQSQSGGDALAGFLAGVNQPLTNTQKSTP